MAFYFVEYTYRDAEDDMAKVRPRHRQFLGHLYDTNQLMLVGPFVKEVEDQRDDNAPGAVLIVRADDSRAALRMLDDDPFRTEGFIIKRRVRRWNPVYAPFE